MKTFFGGRKTRSERRRVGAALMMEALEPRTMMTAAVDTGAVEVFGPVKVSGWVFNADLGATPMNVVVTVDGIMDVLTANIDRPDLAQQTPGSIDHGFSLALGLLTTGNHTLSVVELNPITQVSTVMTTGTIVVPPPTGAVEALTTSTISGWADWAQNATGAVQVVVTVNGNATTLTANGVRDDLVSKLGSANHGFSFSMPTLPTGTNVVTVSVVDPSTNTSQLLKSGTIVVAPPTGAVETLTASTVSGWADWAENAAAPVDVVITINGNATTVTANGVRDDLVSKLGSADHGFSFSMPTLTTGTNVVTVSLEDPSTHTMQVIKSATINVAAPTGAVEKLTASTVSGWADWAGDATGAAQVVITVNGNATTVTADGARADLVKKLGSANHGFSFSMPTLPTGTNVVTVSLVDPSTHTTQLLKSGTIVIAPPTGAVETFTASTISGWADWAENPSAPVDVVITVNGQAVTLSADDTRADLAKKLGSTDHGFSYSLPALHAGSNTVTVDLVDPSTQAIKRIKSGTISVGAPTGAVTTFSNATISGWAFNPVDQAAPVNIVISVNGVTTTLTADDYMASLVKTYGSAYHGFTYVFPTGPDDNADGTMLLPGNNVVTVTLVDPYTGATKLLKSGTLVNKAPTGTVDIHTGTEIAGSVSDADGTGPLQVRIDVDGVPMGDPFTANSTRKLLKGQGIGFDVTGDFAGHVVEVYAYDTQSQVPVLIWTNNHLPKGAVLTATRTNVSGWAVDPDDLTTPLTVEVDLDGAMLTTGIADNDLSAVAAKSAGTASAGFSVDIPGLTPGTHTVKVYAFDGQAGSAKPVLLGAKTIINAPPVGQVTNIDGSSVSGWGLDPDLGTTGTMVSVYVDQQLLKTVDAIDSVPALLSKYKSTNHGFTVDLSQLPAGSHSITVTVHDDGDSDEDQVVIYDGFINNHTPVGAVESVTGTTITGWALDLDTTAAISVDVFVDGTYTITTTANVDRPDRGDSHGFSLDMPTLSFGTHKLTFFAAESQGNVETQIGSVTVTNNHAVGAVESIDGTTISGWAADPDRPTESVDIQVFVNGLLAQTTTASNERDDLQQSVGSTLHGFSVDLSPVPVGVNEIDVYAVDLNTGLLSLIGTKFLTITA